MSHSDEGPLFDGRTIVVLGCFCAYDWELLRQRQQRMVEFLARTNRVVYLERLGARPLRPLPALRALWKRFRHSPSGAGSSVGFRFVKAPIIPLHGWGPVDRINGYSCRHKLRRVVGQSLSQSVCVVFYPSPYVREIVDKERFAYVMYDAAQRYETMPSIYGSNAGMIDAYLARAADFNSTDTSVVQAMRRRDGIQAVRVPQGVDADWPSRAGLSESSTVRRLREKALPGGLVGFVGGIGAALDQDLVASVAEKMSDVGFVLIGPTLDAVIAHYPRNVSYLGAVPPRDVPGVMAALDVGLVPYVQNDMTSAVLPTKLAEYLASGTRVVSTILPEILAVANSFPRSALLLADGVDEWVRAIRSALVAGPLTPAEVQNVVEQSDWDNLLRGWAHAAQEAYARER